MMEIQKRTDLVVYVASLRQVRQLKRFGHLAYVSKRMRYAVLYVDAEQATDITVKLKQLRYVKRVIESPHDTMMSLLGLSGDFESKSETSLEEDDD